MRATGTLSRFTSAKIEVERSMGLSADHPALAEARTIFPSTVVESWDSPRFLVSGQNNPKLGKAVTKGPRAGWPIYHLTLEERATCPRSCPMWAGCYGAAMPYARRHTPDEDFLGLLRAEVVTVARQHPDGLLIRLHTLGDFFSVEYVKLWADLLDCLPQLHVFGFTARREDADDEESRKIAKAIRWLADEAWDQFAIRFSRAAPEPQGSTVYDADPMRPDVIMCPAQTEKTTACASCGLCWAEAAKDKTIGFLRHGMKRTTGPRGSTGNPRGRPRRGPASPPVASTPAERIAALSPSEMLRIAQQYGVTFKSAS